VRSAGKVGLVTAWAIAALACGASDVHPADVDTQAAQKTNVEVAELEINGSGIDRFASCPPPGELGQDWLPPIPAWHAPPAPPADPGTPPVPDDPAMHGSSPTERAVTDTHDAFRSCWHKSLIHDPTQDGHVAIVLRVGGDGRVAKVESYGACSVSSEAIQCMKDAAKKLRFLPPEGGSDTVIIPAVFASSGASSTNPLPSDVYAAAAYVAVEGMRPALHACEESARHSGRSVVASATFSLDVDARGKVVHSNIDPWSGAKELLVCAAAAFEGGTFPKPAGGRGTVQVRIAFNPRVGTK
jgi:hypothetical protein